MKNIFSFIIMTTMVLTFLTVPVCAEEWGEIRETTLNLNVREKRNPKSEHVVTLAKGQRVKVDFLKDNWFAVFNLNETVRDESRAIGYANNKYLKVVKVENSQPVSPVPAPVVVPEDVKSGEGEIKATVATTPPPDPIKVGIDPSRIPVKITSDRMIYDENGKVVSFVGNVVAEHGQLTLWASKLSAFFSSNGKKIGADSVDKIIAEGSVRVKKENTEGTCGKLTYQVEEQILKMEQNPLLQDGPNSLTGEVINFHVRDNRSEVIGGKGQRVKAIFMTPGNLKVQ